MALIAETCELPRIPAVVEIFTHDFIPPASEPVKMLAG